MDIPRALRTLNIALLAGIVVAGLFVVRHLATVSIRSRETPPDGAAAVPTRRAVPPDLFSYGNILTENPFGKASAGPLTDLDRRAAEETGTVTPAPEGLRLIGTIAGTPDYAFAIFEDRSTKQSIYASGDEIPGLGLLVEVHPDEVVIRSPSGPTRFALAEISTALSPPLSRAGRSRRGRDRGARKPSPNRRGEVAFIRETGGGKYLLDKEGVQKSLQNPQRVLTDARMLPNFVDGAQQGFKVSEVIPGGVYDKLGLRNGDILLKINDLALNSPDSGIQAFSTLRGADRIKLYIVRDDKKITQTYQIR